MEDHMHEDDMHKADVSHAEDKKAAKKPKSDGKLEDSVESPAAKAKMRDVEAMRKSKGKDGDVKKASKHLSEMADEAVEKGYAEDALTDDQKVLLAYEESFRGDSEDFEADEDGDNYTDRRQQI